MKNKEKPIVFDIDIPIFDSNVTFCICSQEQFRKFLEDYSFGDALITDIFENRGMNGCTVFGPKFDVIYIADMNSHKTIAHEILHFVFGFLHRKGLVPSSDSEETYTYLMGYITDMFYKNKIKHEKKI